MTKEDYDFHMKEEKNCHVRGDFLTVLRKLNIVGYKFNRNNFMNMLMHAAQQERYNWQEACKKK